ncbi:signal transduction histidine kinase [Vibrio variabilis]|uniref:Signal transduction histidine kinase n=1 Tax=Vibrio variabilis TaxID=990271 RepID=A0ABQ0JHC8_9VIBR|nr:signal transduction histidine kinase [Vibrio variabilis]
MPNLSKEKLRQGVKKLSLKTRLLLAATLWLSAMTIAAGVSIPGLVRDYLISDLEIQLGHAMDEIAANLEVDDQGQLMLATRLSDPRFNQLQWTLLANQHKERLFAFSLLVG